MYLKYGVMSKLLTPFLRNFNEVEFFGACAKGNGWTACVSQIAVEYLNR